MPLALPGFEHVKRGWNAAHECYAARIMPGEYYVTKNDESVYTTLGSCISACIRDRVLGIGGMNHFMLPATDLTEADAWKSASISASTRYGNYAMEHLINEILRNGGKRQNLEVKVFGGGRILANMTDVGLRNIAFVRDYLKVEGLRVTSEDVGDIFPRMVVYFPATGKVRVKRLRSLHTNTIASQEKSYIESIKAKPVSGDVELF
ncbi:MAG: chemoreceptor glutamine deamidase CheD [Sulfurimicrobium sp.]|jgi:chemotaxis protein CheD|nr:chemoreceptor glutamine deamidase CheD [Sulfurimicrobium sp.]MDO9190278.1 chemoreceptor glutamine deamidase CheD [Sulfurimicrobium sp.]MDP1705827.1 chemoreceptor glutamine deamidase CheD [Sulfurimicrobium sp.]MDP2198198.1 chemoreceptor glutamine deamidase CheD [Sulfurimicrobium sp.]MDP3688283.1 chemoreceptor glutamine deamidase CheD [Sulfurimicrobium sp.]